MKQYWRQRSRQIWKSLYRLPRSYGRDWRAGPYNRAPLGELNAAGYYANGCNAFSYTVIYDEEEAAEYKKPSSPLAQSQQALSTTSIASVLDAVLPRLRPRRATLQTRTKSV